MRLTDRIINEVDRLREIVELVLNTLASVDSANASVYISAKNTLGKSLKLPIEG